LAIGDEFLFFGRECDFAGVENFDGLGNSLVAGAEFACGIDKQFAGLAAAFLGSALFQSTGNDPFRTVAVLDTSGGAAAFSPSVAAASARIDRLAAAAGGSLPTAIAEARRLLAGSELARKELSVFTDCSHGAWDNAAPQPEPTAGEPAVLFVDVGASAPRNFAIDALDLSGERISAGTSLAVTASASRSGPDATRAVAVEVLGRDECLRRVGAALDRLGDAGS
jgi:hypothetical protein